VHMEYRLNRAAGFDGKNWTPFSRIINISWPGDTGSTDFMQAELNAMNAGRRLVPLLQQLQDAGIAVNLITHSLGARVALTALNILGTIGRRHLVDHLFLWQPAVADNALTNDPGRDAHPLGLGVFHNAYTAARQVVVLHSKGDGILGPATQEDQNWWLRFLRLQPLPGFAIGQAAAAKAREILTSDDPMDELLGHLHGAYDKKWWTFPSFLDNGFGPAIKKLYQDYLPLAYDEPGRRGYSKQQQKREALNNWERLEADIMAEAHTLQQPCIDCLRNGERPPRYTLLAPLNHRASISTDLARDYIRRLKILATNQWRPAQPPRPALGYVGFEEVAGEEDLPDFDRFLKEELNSGRIQEVNQSDWLFSHSGMRIPSDELFEKSFLDAIMKPLLKEGVGFGRYT